MTCQKDNCHVKNTGGYKAERHLFEPLNRISGHRTCEGDYGNPTLGKSSLLKLMQKHLLETGIEARQIISMNFESMKQGNRKNSRQRNRNEKTKK